MKLVFHLTYTMMHGSTKLKFSIYLVFYSSVNATMHGGPVHIKRKKWTSINLIHVWVTRQLRISHRWTRPFDINTVTWVLKNKVTQYWRVLSISVSVSATLQWGGRTISCRNVPQFIRKLTSHRCREKKNKISEIEVRKYAKLRHHLFRRFPTATEFCGTFCRRAWRQFAQVPSALPTIICVVVVMCECDVCGPGLP
jgi:hypothetical protein